MFIANDTTEDEREEIKIERDTALVNKSANKLLQIIKTPTRENDDFRSPVQYKHIIEAHNNSIFPSQNGE